MIGGEEPYILEGMRMNEFEFLSKVIELLKKYEDRNLKIEIEIGEKGITFRGYLSPNHYDTFKCLRTVHLELLRTMSIEVLIEEFADYAFSEYQKKMEELKNQAKEMIYVGYDSHSCESWYKCPNCGKKFGSWEHHNKGRKGGDTFFCEGCGTKLMVPY